METKKETLKSTGLFVLSIILGFAFFFIFYYLILNFYFKLIYENVSDPAWLNILDYSGHLFWVLFLIPILLIFKKDRSGFKNVFTKFNSKTVICVVAGLILGLIMNGGSILTALLHGDINMVWKGDNFGLIIIAFIAVLIQSSVEEIIYRGWIYTRIERENNWILAVIGSSISFCLIHLFNPGLTFISVMNITMVGVLLALSVKYTKNIYFACMMHTGWNFSQNFIFGLPNSGMPSSLALWNPTFTNTSFFYDSTFGVEGTLITTLIQLIVIIIFIILIIRQKKKENLNN